MASWSMFDMASSCFTMLGRGFKAGDNLCATAQFATAKAKRLSPYQAMAEYQSDAELKKTITEAKMKQIIAESAAECGIEYKP